MAIRMLDIAAQHAPLQDKIETAAARVLRKGVFILGEEVEALEREIASYSGARFGVGVASGTDALMLALAAHGVGEGSEVVTTPFTYVATVQAVTHLGAKPVFVDIEPRTFCLDPSRLQRAVSRRTRAIVPVHLFGQCAEMDAVCEVASRRKLAVIEDAAQAIGATYHGRPACSLGHAGCLSFYPTKNLGACGDGGMVLTSDEETYERLRLLRVHGRRSGYFYELDGFNSRLDELQAAILRVKLRGLDATTAARRANAKLYGELLADVPGIRTPYVPEHNEHVYHQYCIVAEQRDKLREHLTAHAIDSAVYYPLPLHQQPIYRSLRAPRLPVAEAVSASILALPISPEVIGPEGIRTVCDAIAGFFSG